MKKILVSGVQPSGRLHIGNYFGALKQFVDLQDEYETRIFIANLHALTTLQNPEELKKISREMVLDFLAIGLDPKKVTLYYQSDVPHVTELAWIFSCLTTMPELMRAHVFKDKEVKNADINVGTFNYPLLMAADILVHDADVVPVGKDQKQHIEIAREVARDFNNIYGETLKEPKELVLEAVETVPGTDGQKMSKSYGNTIPLFAEDAEIERAVMGIVTDSSGEYPENVFKIHQLFRTNDELDTIYNENKGQYKKLKELLAEDIKNFIRPMRERRAEWAGKMDEVDNIVAEGGKRMRKVVHDKMVEVRSKVGLIHNA
jgi:tryptophanyl-tRNA synthetase